MATFLSRLDEGFFVKPWTQGVRVHRAISGKALCGIGDVRPASFNTKLKICARCERVANAYSEENKDK